MHKTQQLHFALSPGISKCFELLVRHKESFNYSCHLTTRTHALMKLEIESVSNIIFNSTSVQFWRILFILTTHKKYRDHQ